MKGNLLKNRILRKMLPILVLCLAICGSYLLTSAMLGDNPGKPVVYGMAAALVAALAMTGVYAWKNPTKRDNALLMLVLFSGIVLRIGYMLYTPCNVRSHDLWGILIEEKGHAGYLLRLIVNGQLPESYELQLYQQPLFYLLGAGVSKVLCGILGRTDAYALVDAAKTVSCMAACLTLFAMKDICDELHMKRRSSVIALAVMAFLPSAWYAGGRIAPDGLAAFFIAMAFLYTLRWYREHSWTNTILLALIYGLGVCTKISVGVPALITAAVFLVELVKENKAKRLGNYVLKMLTFAAISLPIGLWYNFRNLILFGQELGYVPGQGGWQSPLFCGDRSVFARSIVLDFENLFATPYANPNEDYNIPIYYLKSALFGEFTFKVRWLLPIALLFVAFALSAMIVWAVVGRLRRVVWHPKKLTTNSSRVIQPLLWFLVFYVSGVAFANAYPYGCSMDFRYMIFLGVPAGILLGQQVETEETSLGSRIAIGLLLAYSILATIWCFSVGVIS